jgi:hypothetical protein
MKIIQVNAYEYQELNQDAMFKVKLWLDEIPFEYETGEIDENGKSIIKYDYASEWEDIDIVEHCEVNGYLFDKWGNCVHHLEMTKERKKGGVNENFFRT